MITTLPDLRKEAIAIEVPMSAQQIQVSGSNLIYMDDSAGYIGAGYQIILPPGQWTILGRANELSPGEIMEQNISEDGLDFTAHDWHEYCELHNLSNQLILIRNDLDRKTPLRP